MRPKEITYDPALGDADGLADGVDSTGSSVALTGALTSGGSFTSADGMGRIIIIKDASTVDQSGATFTVTGTDPNGNSQSEAITGPTSGATVASTKYFKTVTSIAIASPAEACTVDVGTRDATSTAAGQIIPLNYYDDIAATIAVDVSGTVNFTVQETFDSVLDTTGQSANWANISALASKTADTTSTASVHASAVRVLITSQTDGATVRMRIVSDRSESL